MGFLEAVKTCFSKYAVFRGRAPRSEFWWFYLATILMALAAGLVDWLLFGNWEDTGPLETVVNLGILLPTISATVRRLHDTGRSGYYIFVPIAGILVGFLLGFLTGSLVLTLIAAGAAIIVQILWLAQQSEPGMNQYGPNPFDPAHQRDIAEVFE